MESCDSRHISYLAVQLLFHRAIMTKTEKSYSDEEVEEIMDMHAPRDPFSVKELRAAIQDNPFLVTGVVFTLGFLLGLSFGKRKR